MLSANLPGFTLPFLVAGKLLNRFWPQLVGITALAIIVVNVLLLAAAKVALMEPMAGLMLLTFVVLAQLIATVAMFQVLLPGLPSIKSAQAAARKDIVAGAIQGSAFVSLLGAALLPFFLYYVAWGFLGDTIRRYSRIALEMAPLGQSANVLDVLDSRWLLLTIAIAWTLRAAAKRGLGRNPNSFLPIVVIVCETSWIFIGLYVLGRWKESLFAWVGTAVRNGTDALSGAFMSVAHAAAIVPVEYMPRAPSVVLISLFWYMLLPVIWLVLAAIIYGHDLRGTPAIRSVRSQSLLKRYQSLPAFLIKFIDSFIAGYRSRYFPVANGIKLALGTSALLLAVLIIGYRTIDWASAWLWLGSVRLIGQQQPYWWSVLPDAISLFLGNQYQDSTLGIVTEPLRIVFLASVLESVFRAGAVDSES